MATVSDVDLRTWVTQGSTPLLDGRYPSSFRALPSQTGTQLGTNLAALEDYSSSREFVNIAKLARQWVTGNSSTYNTDEYDLMTLDANGYPTAFGGVTTHYKLLWAAEPSLAGDYVFLYSGTGTFAASGGITVTSSSAGRIEFTLAAGDCIFTIDNLGTGGNHPRDFVITRVANEGSTDVYDPEFISTLSIYSAIRFMNWNKTKNSPVTSWADRTPIDYYSWTLASGAPWEICFRLCNELQVDCWVCVPHEADDNFVTQMATLALAELDPNLNLYVEYSNEVWNAQFVQSTWVRAQGIAEYASGGDFADLLTWHGKRTAEVGALVKAVWTGGDTARVTTVLGAQAVNTFTIDTALACALDARAPCGDDIDAVAIAPYFGGGIGGQDYESIVETWDLNQLFSEIDDTVVTGGNSMTDAINNMIACKAVADSYGVRTIAYEGGQHLVGVGAAANNTTISNLFISANHDTRMNDRYDTYLQGWATNVGDLFCNFTHIYPDNIYGSWGSYEQLGDPVSPKRQALEDFAQSIGQAITPRTPSPMDLSIIHSGHSLTDNAINKGTYPGHMYAIWNEVDNTNTYFNNLIGKHAPGGSPTSYRWNNSATPDSRDDIGNYKVLSITEGVPLKKWYWNGTGPGSAWYTDNLYYMRLFVENAWNNGDSGNGATTLLYATWGELDDPDLVTWRADLDTDQPFWEQMADYGAENLPSGAYVYIVPGNLLMKRLYDDIQIGQQPTGVTTINDYFADTIHPNGLAQYALAILHLAVIHHINPNTLGNPNYGLTPQPTTAQADYLKTIVWEIANDYERAGLP